MSPRRVAVLYDPINARKVEIVLDRKAGRLTRTIQKADPFGNRRSLHRGTVVFSFGRILTLAKDDEVR